jgi:hypothetical protein
MKKLIICCVLIYSFLITGCGPADIQKVRERSNQFAGYADTGVNVTRDLFRANLLSLKQKDAVADGFIKLSEAGITFNAAIDKAIQVYGSTVPLSEIEKLFAVFDSSIVTQLIAVIALIKPLDNASKFVQVIETLKNVVLLAAKAFNKFKPVETRLATV